MTLFPIDKSKVDTEVKSPQMREYEELERQYKTALVKAQKSGNAEQIRIARLEYVAHIEQRKHYMAAAKSQLTIFDVK